LTVKRIYRQWSRNEVLQFCGRDGPMREEQIVPALGHDPRAHGQRPGAVRGLLQNTGHERTQTSLDNGIF